MERTKYRGKDKQSYKQAISALRKLFRDWGDNVLAPEYGIFKVKHRNTGVHVINTKNNTCILIIKAVRTPAELLDVGEPHISMLFRIRANTIYRWFLEGVQELEGIKVLRIISDRDKMRY